MLHFLPVEDRAPAALPALAEADPSPVESWDTSCPDWEERLLTGRSLVPDLPLFEAEAAKALRVFKRLRLPDVIGTPALGDVCGEWFYPIVAALFGSYDPQTNIRHISEVFQLIPKGNSKYRYPLPSASEIPSNIKYSLLTSDGCHRALSDRFRRRWWGQWWDRSRTGWWGRWTEGLSCVHESNR
jgi:hypothetical protein